MILLVLVLLLSAIVQPRAFSQTAPSQDAVSDSSAKSNANAELLQELSRMKARIEELETQLKQSGTPAPGTSSTSTSALATAAPADSAPASAPESNSLISTVPASTPASETALPPQPNSQTGEVGKGKPAKAEPFAFADWTWLNGNPRTKEAAFDSKFFTPEIRADVSYVYDFNHPQDDTIGGSSEVFRSDEVHVTQLGVGGDFHYDNVRARLMTQFGLYSTATPRNDASPARGQWDLADAYRYVSEAYGGYHLNALHGVNVDAGIFVSYIGLFSFYNFDNWAYQPSYVSSNTPWFFNGVRVQIFPSAKLKIEPWFINGWQSYGRFNHRPGVGGQIKWTPTSWINIIANNYGVGADALGNPNRTRLHTDDSIEVKYYDRPLKFLDKMAFSLTGDAGCETGGGVNCTGDHGTDKKQSFLGYMFYNRFWFHKDLFGLTLGGGKINNPGRYLVLLPPINGATAASGTPYFTENPGDPFKAWDASATFDYMPSQYITFRWEFDHRAANVPYFTGPGGITPLGGNQGAPGSVVPGFTPDLRKIENRIDLAILVKF
jgi:Putative beta-barrel porin-2, OmpL-like. bbp2